MSKKYLVLSSWIVKDKLTLTHLNVLLFTVIVVCIICLCIICLCILISISRAHERWVSNVSIKWFNVPIICELFFSHDIRLPISLSFIWIRLVYISKMCTMHNVYLYNHIFALLQNHYHNSSQTALGLKIVFRRI